MKNKRIISLIITLFYGIMLVNAQTKKYYRSFNDAYIMPDSVYYLKICNNFKTNQSDIDKLYLLKNLVSLELCMGEMEKVYLPESICQLSNLKELKLPFISISSLPKGFVKLKNLKVLELNMEGFKTQTLKSFNILKNKKTGEQKDFEALPGNLSDYDYIGQRKESIGLGYEEILELKSLESLKLSGIRFTEIDLSKLINLKKLVIEKGSLQSIPNSVFKLKNLEELIIYDEVNTIPDAISQLQNLKVLKLDGVYSISNEINKLSQLKYLELHGKIGNVVTKINALPSTIEYLYFDGLPLADFQFISDFKKLKVLQLNTKYRINGANFDTKCNLITFPNEVLFLHSLESLYISADFNSLPEKFGSIFSNLNYLEISAPLNTLPKSFERMSKLKSLILNEHQLQTLSIDFSKMPSLKEVDIHEYDNPKLILTPKQKQFLENHSVIYNGG